MLITTNIILASLLLQFPAESKETLLHAAFLILKSYINITLLGKLIGN